MTTEPSRDKSLLTIVCAPTVAAVALWLEPSSAWAYLDPGSSSIIFQSLLALVFGIAAGWRTLVAKVRRFLKRTDLPTPPEE